ncbi:MAG: Bro-N domain-containing protein [Mariprofundaceae bacterium]|nr:Bro-N domain-containing protein [Mariprofundaceae bacterium]
MKESKIKLFQQQSIRSHWDDAQEQWYFSVIDVIAVLTDSANPRDYWYKMKIRVKGEEGFEPSTVCRQLKMPSPDGKQRLTDCADTKGVLRIIQSIPSPKAEPFKASTSSATTSSATTRSLTTTILPFLSCNALIFSWWLSLSKPMNLSC